MVHTGIFGVTMITQAIKEIKNESTALSGAYAQIILKLPVLEDSAGTILEVNLDTNIPQAYGSINECNNRIKALVGLVSGLCKYKTSSFLLVPKSILTALPKSLATIRVQFLSLLEELEQVKSDGGFKDVTDDLIIHSVTQQTHPNIDLKTFYVAADNHVDQALKGVHEILAILKPKNLDPFLGAMAGINILEEEIIDAHKTVGRLRKDAKTKATQIENQANSTALRLTDLETLSQNSSNAALKFCEAAEKHANEATIGKEHVSVLLNDITETEEEAKTLRETIETFQSTFDDFQEKIDLRNSTFENGKKEFDDLRLEMLTLSKTSNKYIDDAKDALNWATASGLASSFSTSADELKGPLWRSRAGFYVAIALLFVSAAVAFNGIPWLHQFLEVPKLPKLGGVINATVMAIMLSVISVKIAVLIPAMMLVGFTTRRHRALFHQHQLYIYKKTIASALPGFKDHASSHQEAMAAAAFARLLFNPQEDASRDLTRDAGGQWWLSKWLERVISKGVKSVMAEDGKPSING